MPLKIFVIIINLIDKGKQFLRSFFFSEKIIFVDLYKLFSVYLHSKAAKGISLWIIS